MKAYFARLVDGGRRQRHPTIMASNPSTSTPSTSPPAHLSNLFHVVECGHDVLTVLKRYTNFKALGKGAQGIV
jgi:hypothetical protein